jgi:hypothetical protein
MYERTLLMVRTKCGDDLSAVVVMVTFPGAVAGSGASARQMLFSS